MKKRRILRNLLAVLLCAVCVLGCLAPASAATVQNYPIVYVMGRTWIYDKISTDSPELINYSTDGAMKNMITAAIPYAANAILTGNWDTYNEKTYAMLMDVYKGFALNENGEIINDTGILFKWSEDKLPKTYSATAVNTYQFEYDARLSPLEIADQLNDYIEAVKRVTGKKKVSLIGRCLGTNEMFAYLYKYQEKVNYSGIASVVIYDGSLYGVDMLDAAMGGKIKADSYALGKFLNNYSESADISSTLANAMRLLQTGYGITLSASVVDSFYSNIRDTLVLRFLKSTYATCPGFWSMVYKNYAEAKAYIFSEEGDLLKYSRLIEKIDNYRKNVQLRIPKMIEDMQAKGVYVSAVCKYGFQSYPIYEDAYELSDKLTSLSRQSLGATCSKVDGTLSASFIKNCQQNLLTGDFISPDKQVYSFTGLLPYTTWYIKNLEHISFPACVNPLFTQLCRNQIKIYDVEKYPQYLVYIKDDGVEQIIPMTENNCDPTGVMGLDGNSNNTGDSPSSSSSGSLLQRLLNVVAFFGGIISRLFGWLRGNN